MSSDGEYEWFKTVRAQHLAGLMELLGGEPDGDVLDLLEAGFTADRSYVFEHILRESGLPVELLVR